MTWEQGANYHDNGLSFLWQKFEDKGEVLR